MISGKVPSTTNGVTENQGESACVNEGRRLVIGNLANTTTEEDLKEFLKDLSM